MTKVLSCSDLHLGNYKPYNQQTDVHGVGTRLQERIDAVNTFFEYGTEHGITHYIFNGDIFDKRLKEDINVIEYIVNQTVKAFSKTPKGSTLYLNIGNHDEQSRYLVPNSCELFRNVHVPNHKIVIINKLAQLVKLDDSDLLFVPFTDNIRESKESVSKALKKLTCLTTLFCHLGVSESRTGRFKTSLDGDYTKEDLGWNNGKVKNIVLGHYHTRDFHAGKPNSDVKSIWYQGNLLPMSFNDVLPSGIGAPRGFDVIDTVTGEHKFIDLCAAPYNYKKFDVIDLDNTSLSLEDINKLTEHDYVKVVSTHITKEQLKELDTDDNLKVTIKPQLEDEQVDIEIDKTDDFQTILKKYCELNGIKDDVYNKSLEIINKVQGVVK